MTPEPIAPDPTLGKALEDVAGSATDQPVDWASMRTAISARAAHDLKRRRQRRVRQRFVIPGTLAAGIALFFLVSRPLPWAGAEAPEETAVAGITIDELLDADVTDDQFRALLSGADTNGLLLIAAGDAQDEAPPTSGERE